MNEDRGYRPFVFVRFYPNYLHGLQREFRGVSFRARKKKLHPHSVIDLRSKRKTHTLKPLLKIVPESDGHSPTNKPAMVHIYLWVLQSLWVLQNL
jgi:hypothetical protein